jgi:hypothetical protein
MEYESMLNFNPVWIWLQMLIRNNKPKFHKHHHVKACRKLLKTCMCDQIHNFHHVTDQRMKNHYRKIGMGGINPLTHWTDTKIVAQLHTGTTHIKWGWTAAMNWPNLGSIEPGPNFKSSIFSGEKQRHQANWIGWSNHPILSSPPPIWWRLPHPRAPNQLPSIIATAVVQQPGPLLNTYSTCR